MDTGHGRQRSFSGRESCLIASKPGFSMRIDGSPKDVSPVKADRGLRSSAGRFSAHCTPSCQAQLRSHRAVTALTDSPVLMCSLDHKGCISLHQKL